MVAGLVPAAVTRNKLLNMLNGRKRQARGSGDSGAQARLEEQPAPDEDSNEWDEEYQKRLFAVAAEQAKGEFKDGTWQAFWLTAVEGKDAKEAGAQIGMSPGAVYVAKSRVLARLKEKVRLLQEAQ